MLESVEQGKDEAVATSVRIIQGDLNIMVVVIYFQSLPHSIFGLNAPIIRNFLFIGDYKIKF